MGRFDLRTVKAAAIGQWPAIHDRVTGIDDDFLDTNHGPCPKCGGDDRWRCFDDFDQTGGAVCNQCGKFADGIAVMQWYLGIGFPEALQRLAEFLGVQPTTTPSDSKSARAKSASGPSSSRGHLEFLPWNELLVARWCRRKNIDLESLKSMGARRGRYRNQYPVIAIPIVSESGETVGWTMYDAGDGKLPLWNPKTRQTTWLKVKTIRTT